MIIDFHLCGEVQWPSDVVVVGSGAAGLALASRLAGQGRRVLLLESGGDIADPSSIKKSEHLNDGTIEGLPFKGLREGRARVLGGTTQLWDGECMRLHEIDLSERSWVPMSGWPFALSDLDRHYSAAETWLNLSRRGYAGDRWRGHPHLKPLAWDTEHLRHGFTEYTPQPYLGSKHRERLSRDENVHVLVNATASRILVEEGRARGIEIRSTSGRRETIRANIIVLSAGTIENTRLLLLSDAAGIGLGSGREHTGKYLQDHPIIRTAEVFPHDYRVLQDRYTELWQDGRRLFPKVLLAPSAQVHHQLLDAAAVFEHEYDSKPLDAARRLLRAARRRRIPVGGLRDALIAARAPGPVARAIYRRYVRGVSYVGVRPRHVWLQIWVEQAPRADRYIALAKSRDALGLPQAAIRWTCEQPELETSRRFTRWISAELTRLGIARVRELQAMSDDEAWLGQVRDAFHPAGTTRMASSSAKGVVDTDLQVHAVKGLYVVGGSVFPTSGYGNPTLTIVALAMRLAEHLSNVRLGALE